MNKKYMTGAAALALSLVLSGCMGSTAKTPVESPVVSEDPAVMAAMATTEPTPAPTPTPTPPPFEPEWEFRQYEDPHYQFKLKVPALTKGDKYGLSYYEIRKHEDSEENAPDDEIILFVSHYNEVSDAPDFKTEKLETAEDAFKELFENKVGEALDGKLGYKLSGIDVNITHYQISKRDAVRYEGVIKAYVDDEEKDLNIVGYCIRGVKTPILYYMVDLSDDQSQLEEMKKYVDDMAYSFEDTPVPEAPAESQAPEASPEPTTDTSNTEATQDTAPIEKPAETTEQPKN